MCITGSSCLYTVYHFLFCLTRLNKAVTISDYTLYLYSKPWFDLISHIVFNCVCVCVFALPVYLVLGLVFVLVVLETCCELPQMRRLRQRFYQERVRELDSETTNIIERDHMSDQQSNPSYHVTDHLPVIPSVSEQAASLQQDGKSMPYTPVSESAVDSKLR